MEKTYKNFGDALFELKKKNYDIAYSKIAKKTGLCESTVNALVNRRHANLPNDDIMIKMAECFNLEPSYFYEWRYKRINEFIDSNREFLDIIEKESKKWSKPSTPIKEKKEEVKVD
jgi:transcriptional regulator with XRE-family HTH domain